MEDEIDRFLAEEQDDAFEEQLDYLDEQRDVESTVAGLSEQEKNLSGWGRPPIENRSTGKEDVGAQSMLWACIIAAFDAFSACLGVCP